MGYSSNFSLKTKDKQKVNIKKFLDAVEGNTAIEEIFEEDIEDIAYALNAGEDETEIDMASDESYKWYEYPADMKELSSKMPGIVFALYIEGEEAGDLRVSYFKDGKMQEESAKIIYPEFDESKLE